MYAVNDKSKHFRLKRALPTDFNARDYDGSTIGLFKMITTNADNNADSLNPI